MRTLFNKTLLASASALSVLGLLLATPGAMAQEMEATDDVEMETTEGVITDDGLAEESVEMEGAVEMEDSEFESNTVEMEETDIDGGVVEMESEGIDSDVDFDDDDDLDAGVSTPTYSNSPRALW